jgi:hypothetical protein
MRWCHHRIGLRQLVLAIGLAALTEAFVRPVHAEVRISGNVDALVLEAREASIGEVLAALRARFNVARLFNGQNYVMRVSAGGIELIVLGPGAPSGDAVGDAMPNELPVMAPSPSGDGWSGVAPASPKRHPLRRLLRPPQMPHSGRWFPALKPYRLAEQPRSNQSRRPRPHRRSRSRFLQSAGRMWKAGAANRAV